MDRKFLQHAFESYVSSFDAADERIALKIEHTYHVARNCDGISARLGLGERQKDIAWAIGMLHDIGRFEQVARSHSFVDSVAGDHAEAGVKALFTDGRITDFIPFGVLTAEELEEIRLAIHLHNKLSLADGLSPEQELFCNIIRDADKLDIFRVCTERSFRAVHEYTEEEVRTSDFSPAVTECFDKRITLDYSKRRTPADLFLGHIAMCFGLYYPDSRREAYEQGYVEKMMDFTFADEANQAQWQQMQSVVRDFLANG